jgi:hypothetical protein
MRAGFIRAISGKRADKDARQINLLGKFDPFVFLEEIHTQHERKNHDFGFDCCAADHRLCQRASWP